MTLYEITDDIKSLLSLIEESVTDSEGNPKEPGEEEKAALMEWLRKLEGNYETKAENILKYRANLAAFSESCKTEEERLYKRRKTADNKAKALLWLLEESMRRLGAKRITAGTFTLTVQKNPPYAYIANANILPSDYWRVIPEQKEPDKKRILEDLKAGLEVPGALLSQGEGLRVK